MTEAETGSHENDVVQGDEIPEVAEGSVALEAAEEEHSLLHRIKEAGEAGKKEWEQVLSQARGFLSQARDDHEAPQGSHWERVQKETGALFGRAQDRGADLLLSLIAQVRKGAEVLEDNLRKARERVASEASPEAPEAPVGT